MAREPDFPEMMNGMDIGIGTKQPVSGVIRVVVDESMWVAVIMTSMETAFYVSVVSEIKNKHI